MKEQLLSLDYFQTRLNQAQRDVELFTVLIQEINDLIKRKEGITKEKNFLKIMANRETNENS